MIKIEIFWEVLIEGWWSGTHYGAFTVAVYTISMSIKKATITYAFI